MSGELGVLTLDMVARTTNFEEPLKRAERQMDTTGKNISVATNRIEKDVEKATNSIGMMGTGIKTMLAGISVGAIVSIADGYTQTAARISNATKSTEEYTLVQKHLYETANGTYRSLKEAQEVYLGSSDGLQELGYKTKQVLAITDSLSYSFVHNATSADKAQSAMDAYGTILDKGKVEADAWFSLIRAAPNILSDVAKATGKSTAEIRKLGAEGKLAATDLHEGLLRSRDANKALSDAMVNSAADGGKKLSNAIERVVGELNRSSGATGVFASGLGLVADNIDTVSSGVVVAAGYMAGTYLSALGASTVAGYNKTRQLAEQTTIQLAAVTAERNAAATSLATAQAQVVNTQATLANLQAERALEAERLKAQISAQGRLASITRFAELGRIEAQVKRELAVATTAETAAQERSNIAKSASVKVGSSALAFLGGPVGLGITVATVAAGYLLMRDNTVKATDSLASQIPAVQNLTQEYQKLNEQQLITERSKLKNAMAENRADIKQTVDALGSLKVSWELGFDVSKWQKYNTILGDLKNGAISGNQALAEFNKLGLSSNIIEEIAGLTTKLDQSKLSLDKNSQATGLVNNQLINTGNSASKSAGQIDRNSSALDSNASSAYGAAAAQSEYMSKLKQSANQTETVNKLIAKGYDIDRAKALSEAYYQNGGKISADDVKAVDRNITENKKLQSSIDAVAEAKRKASDASKKSASDAKKADTEAKRQQKDDAKDYKQVLDSQYEIAYRYGDRIAKMQSDLTKEQSEIRKAYASDPTVQNMYLNSAKKRHDDSLRLYDAQLGQELYSFKMNENEKLNVERGIEQMRISQSFEYSDAEKKSRIKALNERHTHEMAWLNLEQEQRISDAGESLRSDLENLDIRYGYERRQIELNSKISNEEKLKLIALSKASQESEKRQNLKSVTSAWGGTFSDMTGTQDQYGLEEKRFSRYDESQSVFDAQMSLAETATERESIWQAHHDRMSLIESSYQIASMQLQLGYGEQMASSMTTMMGAIFGEKSKAYAAFFAVEKAFAVGQAALAMGENIAQASKIGFPYNIPMIAGAMAQGAQIASIISSATVPAGYYNGGYTGDGGKYEYAGPAHKGEVVFSQEDIKRWGGVANVEKMRTQRSVPVLTPKVGNGLAGRDIVQKQATPNVNLNPNFVIVDERESMSDYLFSPDGTKAFVKFFKRNRSALGV